MIVGLPLLNNYHEVWQNKWSVLIQAMKILKDIEERLQGKYQKSKGLPLSIEGHVHALIKVKGEQRMDLCL